MQYLLDCRFDRESGAKLAEALSNNRTLTELNVFSNRIDSQAFLSICTALKVNDMLVTLKVRSRFFLFRVSETEQSPAEVQKLAYCMSPRLNVSQGMSL